MGGISDGFAYLNPNDFESLNLKKNRYIKIIEEYTGNWTVLRVKPHSDVEEFTLLADPNILENLGFIEDNFIEVEPFLGEKITSKEAIIEFTAHDSNPEEIMEKDNRKALINFVTLYCLRKHTKIYWPEMNTELNVEITQNFPNVNVENRTSSKIYIIDNSTTVRLREEIQSMPFNALLLIDKSQSMSRKDVLLDQSESHISNLYNIFSQGNADYLKTNYRELYDWFKKLRNYINKGKNIDKKKNNHGLAEASRLDSVILAILTFFQLKISRGKGEICSFVLYGDEAKVIKIDDLPYIEATDFSPELCNTLLETIFDHNFMRYGQTNISAGVRHITKIAKLFKRHNNNPLMILLLTDGKPHPKELDDPHNVLANFKDVKEKLDEMNSPFVLYTLGLGRKKAVDNNLLSRLAKIGDGEYHFVRNMDDLVNWYEKLAQEYTLTLNGN